MDPHRLASNLRQLSRLLDWRGFIVHVALTARREAHSGLVAGLKESQRAEPEWHKRDESPGAGRMRRKEHGHERGRYQKRDKPESTALRLPAGSDVRNHNPFPDLSCLRKVRI